MINLKKEFKKTKDNDLESYDDDINSNDIDENVPLKNDKNEKRY